ncbi:hypothetical protein AB0P44_46515, partial [Streptomyces chartreusis]
MGILVLALALAGLVALPKPAHAAQAVCALACDTLDPSKARQETFPVPDRNINGRVLRLHVSDPDNMAWASIDKGARGDSVWLDRSWDRAGVAAGPDPAAPVPDRVGHVVHQRPRAGPRVGDARAAQQRLPGGAAV